MIAVAHYAVVESAGIHDAEWRVLNERTGGAALDEYPRDAEEHYVRGHVVEELVVHDARIAHDHVAGFEGESFVVHAELARAAFNEHDFAEVVAVEFVHPTAARMAVNADIHEFRFFQKYAFFVRSADFHIRPL